MATNMDKAWTCHGQGFKDSDIGKKFNLIFIIMSDSAVTDVRLSPKCCHGHRTECPPMERPLVTLLREPVFYVSFYDDDMSPILLES